MQATKERSAMARKIKAKRILQLRDGGLSRTAIARSTGMSKQSVCDVFDVAEEQGIAYDDVRDMPDDEVYRLLFPDRNVFGNGFLDILAARFRQSGKRTADVSDFCLPEHQGLVHPLARAVELDESSMVDHPVDHRGGKLVVAQDRSPFAELDVGGEHHASLLVAC